MAPKAKAKVVTKAAVEPGPVKRKASKSPVRAASPAKEAKKDQKAEGTSQYKQIDGVRYEKDLLEFADEAVKSGGTISIAEAKELWNKAMDGNKVTPTERRTLEYIMKEKKFTEPAAKYLKGELEKTVDNAKPVETKEDEVVEQEKDAPADKRPQLKEGITFDSMDCTLNVLPTMQGKVLMSLSDGGMQFLIAGARANVGIKSGRYMFECKVIEALNPAEAAGNRGKVPLPRQLVRMGFSTASTQLILGESNDGICFDAEGFFTAEMKKTTVCPRFGKNQVMGVLLNLDEKSPNHNTISLFHNGARVSEPQALPEALKGKTLYPHVSYRNVSVQVHFGSEPLSALPFKCRTIQTAATADVEVRKSSLPKDGKHEVVFPVAFPDEGTFDWLDTFLDKNPDYVELSDRKIIEWAGKSGLFKPKLLAASAKNSNDRPEYNYGLTAMDDLSCRRVLQAVAPLVPRNYIVMEVKENLTADDRAAALKRFASHSYKRVAHVVMGEPNDEFKKVVHSKILKEKQDKAETEWKARKVEQEKKKALAARQKQLSEMRKKAELAKKKAEAEKKKKIEEALKKKKEAKEAADKKKKEEADKKKAEAEEKAKAEAETAEEKDGEEAEGEDEKAKEEAEAKAKEEKEAKEKEEEAEAAKAKEEEEAAKAQEEEEAAKAKEEEEAEKAKEDEEKEEEEEDEPMPQAELSDEDKKIWFAKPTVSDLTSQVMSSAFGKFTVPEKGEGFDDIRYEWQGAAKANSYLRTWVLDKKVLSKMEDLKPSDWFKEKHAAFTKSLKEWQAKQKPLLAKKKEEEKKKAAKAAADEEEEEEEKGDDVDIFTLEDICDIGNGEPLFLNFSFEDWSLLTLRYELFLLVKAFMHDCDDEDRKGVHETNFPYYYNKYYHKQLSAKLWGKDKNTEVVDMVKDTVTFCKDSNVLKTDLASDEDSLDIFVKMTEDGRRERQRRIDAGDETAKIKFNPQINQVSKPTAPVATTSVKTGTAVAARPAGTWAAGVRPAVTIRPAFGGVRPWGAR